MYEDGTPIDNSSQASSFFHNIDSLSTNSCNTKQQSILRVIDNANFYLMLNKLSSSPTISSTLTARSIPNIRKMKNRLNDLSKLDNVSIHALEKYLVKDSVHDNKLHKRQVKNITHFCPNEKYDKTTATISAQPNVRHRKQHCSCFPA
ncbi:unnamed protein product [Didymodactylos carnosus]|uniref:Uncharacterized protein n=1 Tax=Didymodactylos carnosus TaxID=1234261 RepID=A0A815IWJ5_9BILA|nr:unnamed protein product [Didymodactylos carnosus]CAF1374375.1 unnamed protein product [Didymodactylos carnosus]CAF3773090.1 unnamed protein product [Didymodactylos carnosus]CAF4263640.1 unnamed protein product [Didymodactylos carnosus]